MYISRFVFFYHKEHDELCDISYGYFIDEVIYCKKDPILIFSYTNFLLYYSKFEKCFQIANAFQS